jgi:hypothetical protein
MRTLVMVVGLLAAGCKRDDGAREQAAAMEKMRTFMDAMCACKDKACADKVQDELNVWSEESARNAGSHIRKPTDDEVNRMSEVGTRYGECMAHAMGADVTSRTPSPPSGMTGTQVVAKFQSFVDRACACTTRACASSVTRDISDWSWSGGTNPPTADQLREIQVLTQKTSACVAKAGGEPTVDADGVALAPSAPMHDADAVIRHTYSGLGKYVVSAIQLDYVRAGGEIDPKYGKATFVLGIATPPDPGEDPDRPLGAPIVDAAPPPDISGEECPRFEWTKGTRSTMKSPCALVAAITRPKCSVVEVWRRAIAAKAPAEGLARLTFQNGASPAWSFAIDDAPRKVKVRQTIADTCEPTAERPTLPF